MTLEEVTLKLREAFPLVAQLKGEPNETVWYKGVPFIRGDGRSHHTNPFDPIKDWKLVLTQNLLSVLQEVVRTGSDQAWAKLEVLYYCDCHQFHDERRRGSTLIPRQLYEAMQGKVLVQVEKQVYPEEYGDFFSFLDTVLRNEKDTWWQSQFCVTQGEKAVS